MIQRIQTLYLIMVLFLSLTFFPGAVLHFSERSGTSVSLLLNGLLADQSGQSFGQVQNIWPLTAILILLAILSAVTIFLYKNRKIQIILAKTLVAAAALLIIALSWYCYNAAGTYNLVLIPGIKMALPLFILLFTVLALRGILSDERLVKSYDRLR
jgi:hypothetical protein